MNVKILLFFGLFVLSIPCLWAQNEDVLRFMTMSPFQSYSSPATKSIYNGYFAIPILSDLSIGLYNSGIHYNSLFKTENGYPTAVTTDKFVESLQQNNWINLNLNTELFGLGLRFGNFFASIDCRLRLDGNTTYSKDVFALPLQGNLSYSGDDNSADMEIAGNITLFHEWSVSLQQNVNEHFSWGVRPKLLFGIFNFSTNQLNAQLFTDADSYEMRLLYHASANMACSMPYLLDLNGNERSFEVYPKQFQVADLFRNIGAAIDLGAQYNFNDHWSLSASALDVGFIHWSTNCTHIQSQLADAGHYYDNGSFIFSGLNNEDIEAILSDSVAQNAFLDTLAAYFPTGSSSGKPYYTTISARFAVQGMYHINEQQTVTALLQANLFNNHLLPSFTLAYNGFFGKHFDICVAYSVTKNTYANIGLGIGLKFGAIAFFVTTENVVPAFTQTDFSCINARLGATINWKKKDKMIKQIKK